MTIIFTPLSNVIEMPRSNIGVFSSLFPSLFLFFTVVLVLEFELRALPTLSKSFTTELYYLPTKNSLLKFSLLLEIDFSHIMYLIVVYPQFFPHLNPTIWFHSFSVSD